MPDRKGTNTRIRAALPCALDAHPFAPCIRRPSSPLSGEEETLLRRWLAQDGETDPAIIADTIDQCQRDANARRRSLEMAEDELEAFEERAAIMEFDGGLIRAEAERLALSPAGSIKASGERAAEELPAHQTPG